MVNGTILLTTPWKIKPGMFHLFKFNSKSVQIIEKVEFKQRPEFKQTNTLESSGEFKDCTFASPF